MSDSAPTAATTTPSTLDGYAESAGLRVALSPYLFRGMLVGMAAVAIALHRTTGSRELAWRFAKRRARTLEWLLGVRTTVHGLEHVASGAPVIYASNHQSHLDILALLGHLPGRTRFAAKQELWRHPVVGGVLDTLGMIPIDRDAGARSIDVLNQAAAERHSIVIFPEGTRSRDGRLRDFKKGAFTLAIATGLPIVPICCRGTRRLMPRGSRLAVVPGDIDLFIEPPLPTTGLHHDDREALAARVREAIERNHTGW